MEGLSFQAGDSVGELTQNLQTSLAIHKKMPQKWNNASMNGDSFWGLV